MENSNQITYQVESMDQFEPEARGLMAVYNSEIQLAYQLKPDYMQYRALERVGCFVLITARQAGTLIGFFGLTIHPNPNSVGKICATGTTLFVLPQCRGTVGVRLLKYGEAMAKNLSADTLLIASQHVAPIDALLERFGFKPAETIFAKEL